MTDDIIDLTHRCDSLQILEIRPVIDQACGIVMAWMGCDSETALRALLGVSNRLHRPVLTTAEEVLNVVQTSDPAALIAWLRAQLGPVRERTAAPSGS